MDVFSVSNMKEYKKIVFDALRIIRGKKRRLDKDFKNQSKFAYCVYCKYQCDKDNIEMKKIWDKTNKITTNMCNRLLLYERILTERYDTGINKKGNKVIFLNNNKRIYSIKI